MVAPNIPLNFERPLLLTGAGGCEVAVMLTALLFTPLLWRSARGKSHHDTAVNIMKFALPSTHPDLDKQLFLTNIASEGSRASLERADASARRGMSQPDRKNGFRAHEHAESTRDPVCPAMKHLICMQSHTQKQRGWIPLGGSMMPHGQSAAPVDETCDTQARAP
jgi:hypothetical protein